MSRVSVSAVRARLRPTAPRRAASSPEAKEVTVNETPPQPPQPGATPGAPGGEPYALTFDVPYPDRDLDRVSTGFRIFTIIPIAIVLAAVGGGYEGFFGRGAAAGGGILFLPALLMILFRKKYPRWWFDWNRELLRFTLRVYAYFWLMSDIYPSTDEQQYVHLEIEYPNVESDRGRGMPLVKWFLAIPHYFVLLFLYIG